MLKRNAALRLLYSLAALTPLSAMATNGMNLEGYGPIAAAMGGSGMAYDNGNAAMMNNPATLSLMAAGNRLDLALGDLGPDVKAKTGGMSATSASNAFYMPAAGWAHKIGPWAYGLGVFGQGGMGTEYDRDSFMSNPGQLALSPNLINRSEVSVGRIIAPLAYDWSDKLHIGGTVDFVWAGMDLKMAMSESQFQDLANPASQQFGAASGSMVSGFGRMYEPFGGTGISKLHSAYFDFSNSSDFTGKARGYGYGGKLGLVYQFTPSLTLGAAYHSKTHIGDLETSDAKLSMSVNIDTGVAAGNGPSGTYVDTTMPLTGKVRVKDFQWPAMLAIGAAFRLTSQWLMVADVKRIQWADVLSEFNMSFTADQTVSNGGFAGAQLDTTLYQHWKDQTVFTLGTSYQITEALTLRAGVNLADNPLPSRYLNALFPAIIENHYTAGFGYVFTQRDSINFSLTHAPEVSVVAASGVTSTHGQTNWQVMYTRL